ncbi:MAG: hypothetical protein U0325_32355 [Polyangiales bacterium]
MKTRLISVGLAASWALVGCGANAITDAGVTDAGGVDSAAVAGDAGLPPSFRTPAAAAFTNTTNAARTLHVTLTGEGEAQNGFDYTAAPPMGERVFVDGWELRFRRVITTVANVRLNRPGTTPSDPSMVGAPVFTSPRSFAVNAAKAGSITSGDGETSIPLLVIPGADGGGALDPMVRYAFSFDLVGASAAATNVNLDEGDVVAYEEMLRRGWTWLFEGTATYRGVAPMAGSAFASYPTTVAFRFGFGADARYLNCNNPDNGGDVPGVAPNANNAVTAQITLHIDHLFWGALGAEDPPLRFDHLAARARGAGDMGEVTMDDLMGVVPTNLRDRMNRAVGDRGGQTMGYTARDPNALRVDLGGNTGLNDLRDVLAFSQRASGHLNSEGLCTIRPVGGFRY